MAGARKHPRLEGLTYTYGTAGFRTAAATLEPVLYRVGLLAALRSKVKSGGKRAAAAGGAERRGKGRDRAQARRENGVWREKERRKGEGWATRCGLRSGASSQGGSATEGEMEARGREGEGEREKERGRRRREEKAKEAPSGPLPSDSNGGQHSPGHAAQRAGTRHAHRPPASAHISTRNAQSEGEGERGREDATTATAGKRGRSLCLRSAGACGRCSAA